MTDARTIVAFGEILWDLLPTGAFLGGAPFNFACRSAMLGDKAHIVSRVGADDLGDRAVAQAAAHGVDVGAIQRDTERPTGTVRITFDAQKNPDITIVPDVAYDAIALDDDLLMLASSADCLCFGTVAQRTPGSRGTLQALLECAPNAVKLYDVNLRRNCYTPEIVAQSLERATIAKLNADEADEISRMFGDGSGEIPDVAVRLAERWTLDCCVVTLAEQGALAVSKTGQAVYVPGYAVDLVDPLGAGDAFTAGFIHRYLRGEPLVACCAFGNILGALTAGQEGATGQIMARDIDALAHGATPRTVDPRLSDYLQESE